MRLALLIVLAMGMPAEAELPAFTAPPMTPLRTDVEPFQYIDVGAKIPSYVPGEPRAGQRDPWTKMQQPLPPDESIKHFVTPVGFEIRLFASEPQLGGKPIAIAFDERGRLWVLETYDYPNELQSPGQGRDRIRICEDTDGDGRADRFNVFAENLSIPTAILCVRGGAVVQNGAETWFLKDTDGDGRADVRRTLISGWGVADTHAGVSNFRYGLDNWIWAVQGYNHSEPTVEGRKHQSFGMGVFRFRLDAGDPPRVAEIELVRSTNNNTWGLGFSEEGLVFASTANRNPSVYMPIANRYYERVRGWAPGVLGTIADTHLFHPVTDKIRQVDHHGGYTAAAGHALYTARTYPKPWWNQTALVCEPTGHLVGVFALRRDGADFRSSSPANLVASDDEWSAPIMAEVGPDGNVWIVDWYNYIVQHNPTPQGFQTGKGNAYESDLRDKKHGRIYRVVQTGAEPLRPKSLTGAAPQTLVETLKADNMLWRSHAQRLLVERGRTDVVPGLLKLVADRSMDEIGLNVGAIHALWTLHGLGQLDGSNRKVTAAAVAALVHPSAGVRRNAIEVLPKTEESATPILDSQVLWDADAQVRLAALLALADLPASGDVVGVILRLLGDPEVLADRWLRNALSSAAAGHDVDFLINVATDRRVLLLDTQLGEVMQIVAEHFARAGNARVVGPLVAKMRSGRPEFCVPIIEGLFRGWPKDKPVELTPGETEALVELMSGLPTAAQARLVSLAQRWGNDSLDRHTAKITVQLLAHAADETNSDEARIAAARQLIEFRAADPGAARILLALAAPRYSQDVALPILEAVGRSEAPETGAMILESLPKLTPSMRSAALRLLLGRAEWTDSLLAAVDAGQVNLAELSLDEKQALAAHPNLQIRERAKKLLDRGGLPNPDRQKVLDELLPLAQRGGDPSRGKEIFKRECAKCHVYGGEGNRIGPDLTGMAVRPKAELLTQIIDPSRSLEGNYRAYTVMTSGGRIITGLLASESKTAIELFDAEGKKVTLLRKEVDEVRASAKSLMPEGFEKQMNHEELVNLLAFLTRKGEPK